MLCIDIVPIVCVQNQYNLAHRTDDALIGDLARDDIAYVPFFPLGGFSPLCASRAREAGTEQGIFFTEQGIFAKEQGN